ncbi:MAG: hypothetical protein ACFWUA_02405 [Sporanaerobacter sp.]|uniref:group II intron maturase-specific domain-containing protein n=1 Tax=Sporanaerobacter sp. TaxID=2010183 RepID=UPI003A0FCD2D
MLNNELNKHNYFTCFKQYLFCCANFSEKSLSIYLFNKDNYGIFAILVESFLFSTFLLCAQHGQQLGGESPLLANIMLNELDQKLEEWGYLYVRYADDLLIFTKSKRAAERQYERASKHIEGKLKLKINKEKTQISKLSQIKYLGYSFYKYRGKCRFRIHPKSIKRLKDKLRTVTGRSNRMSIEGRKLKINQIIRGWVQYFKLADMKGIMQDIDEWLRRRIRMITWKRWKRLKQKVKTFRNLE